MHASHSCRARRPSDGKAPAEQVLRQCSTTPADSALTRPQPDDEALEVGLEHPYIGFRGPGCHDWWCCVPSSGGGGALGGPSGNLANTPLPLQRRVPAKAPAGA